MNDEMVQDHADGEPKGSFCSPRDDSDTGSTKLLKASVDIVVALWLCAEKESTPAMPWNFRSMHAEV